MFDSYSPTRQELEQRAEKFVKAMTNEQLMNLLKDVLPKKYPMEKDKCPHLNTEATHPYGWLACLDCGKLLD